MSAAFFSPSHASSCSLSHEAASIADMNTWWLRGSNRSRLSSWMSSRMKSSSADPDLVRMSRFRAATEAWLRSISSATMAGSVSIGAGGAGGAGGAPAGGATGASSGSDRTKSPRSRTVSSASRISGSPVPITSRRAARVAGDARRAVTSTNSRPPASTIGARVVSRKKESPRGFMASVIIWPWPTET